MKPKFDYMIVGAGFTGSVLANLIATRLNKTVLLIDRRDHVGGNAADVVDQNTGHRYNLHGPHIFHTNSSRVFDYLSQFTDWLPYTHYVSADLSPTVSEEELFQLPVNFNTIRKLYPVRHAELIIDALKTEFGEDTKVPVLRLIEESRSAGVRDFGEQIWEYFFKNYTQRQWGMDPKSLDPMVTGRVPIRLSYDDRHFQDHYQYSPMDGYSAMFGRMLNHDNIHVVLGADYKDYDEASGENLIFTGGIDFFFDYYLGHLPYRSMDIRYLHVPSRDVFPVATINYPNTEGFLRATEQPKITGQRKNSPQLWGSFIMTEAPKEYDSNDPCAEQYYPIPTKENRHLHGAYERLAESEYPDVVFAGRLGSYLYIEMGQAVAHAMSIFENRILPKVLS